jgi:hypothetical protein
MESNLVNPIMNGSKIYMEGTNSIDINLQNISKYTIL